MNKLNELLDQLPNPPAPAQNEPLSDYYDIP